MPAAQKNFLKKLRWWPLVVPLKQNCLAHTFCLRLWIKEKTQRDYQVNLNKNISRRGARGHKNAPPKKDAEEEEEYAAGGEGRGVGGGGGQICYYFVY